MNLNNKLKGLAFVLFFILVFSSLTGCITQEGKNPKITPIRDSLIIGIGESVHGFHPWMESYDVITLNINMNIFNSLVEFDNIFRTKPKLATSWNNPNNLTWRFYLRENVKFHNGYNFTAEDVKYTIDLIKGDNTSVLRDLLLSVKEVKIVDDLTVDIITEKPCSILLNKLVDIPIACKKYVEETTEKKPIGTGAYKLVEYVPDEYVKLERFDDYWGEVEVKNVTFKIIKNDEEMKNATINGTIEIADNILPKYYKEVLDAPGVRIGRCAHPTVVFASFDFREYDSVGYKGEKNPLSDVRVRKAIYHAINITDIIDNVLNGSDFAEPASQFVTPMIFGYNPNIERLPYDLNESRELLKEAGYEEGFELVLDCAENYTQHRKVCEVLKTQLSEIIDVKLNLMSAEDYWMKIIHRNTSFYILGWLAATGDGGEIYDYMIRTVDQEAGVGTYNLGYYSNPEVDSIGEKISHILDTEERLELMQEGFRVAMEDVAWVPLYIPKCIYGIADYIAWNPRSDYALSVEEMGFK